MLTRYWGSSSACLRCCGIVEAATQLSTAASWAKLVAVACMQLGNYLRLFSIQTKDAAKTGRLSQNIGGHSEMYWHYHHLRIFACLRRVFKTPFIANLNQSAVWLNQCHKNYLLSQSVSMSCSFWKGIFSWCQFECRTQKIFGLMHHVYWKWIEDVSYLSGPLHGTWFIAAFLNKQKRLHIKPVKGIRPCREFVALLFIATYQNYIEHWTEKPQHK